MKILLQTEVDREQSQKLTKRPD